MKISKILKVLPTFFVLIAVISIALIVSMFGIADRVQTNRAESKQLGLELQKASDYLTEQVRSYAVTGEKAYFSEYEKEIKVTQTREKVVEELMKLGAPQNELDLLSDAKKLSDDLSKLEYEAFDLVEKGDKQTAQNIVFGEEYYIYKAKIAEKLSEFQTLLNNRCDKEYDAAHFGLIISIIITVMIIIVIIVLVIWSFRLLNRKVKNIEAISEIAERISVGDFNVDASSYISEDEFGRLAQSFTKVVNSINDITSEITKISDAAIEGDFKKRAETEKFSGGFADVLNRMNNMLEILIEEEQKVSNLKSQFLVNMSHEIRTPMNAVIGLSELALKRQQSDENYDTYKKINTSSKNLLSIINDILDFSKIEAEKLDIVEDDFFLEEIVSNAFMMASERIEDKPIEMLLDVKPDVPYALNGDKTRLWQVLKNILDNSAKYTGAGRIILTIAIKKYIASEKDEKMLLSFVVEDTGYGMSKEQLDNLFIPFQQFHTKGGARNVGTGLGMSITKQLVDLMGGEISITSQLNEGTKVTIDLPFVVTDSKQTLESIVTSNNISASNILLVDDDENALTIMSGLLEKMNVNPICARNSAQALEEVVKIEDEGKKFDIILLDYHLGEENGLDLGAKIKSKNSEQKLLMVSAYSKKLINVDIKKIGFTDIIEKPFIPTQFIRRLCDTINSNKVFKEQQYDQFKNARVLVCEDNEINQDVITGILNLFGISPKIANNGKEAIEILNEGHFDLILMDIIMPIMDGYEAATVIRMSKKIYKDIPIIAMTANVMKDEIEKCFLAGMNGHIGKPLSIEEAYTIISKYLKYHKDDKKKNTDSVKKIEIEYPNSLPDIDVETGIERFVGNKKAYFNTLIKFADGISDYQRPFDFFISEETKDECQRYLHTLKGVASNLSATELTKLAVQLEIIHKTRTLSEDEYNSLMSMLEETKRIIQEYI